MSTMNDAQTDVPDVNDDGEIVNFNEANAINDSFNLKVKLTGPIDSNGIYIKKKKNVEIMVTLKYLSNFRKTLEMFLINCEITVDLNWSKKSVIADTNVAGQSTTFSITDTKLYVPVATLSNSR